MTLASKEEGNVYRPGYETVARKIIDYINGANLQPGDRMPTEQSLGEQLGVSRAMVREAIKILTASGHVRTRRGSGIYVGDGSRPFATASIDLSMPIDPEHVRAFFEFRSLQERMTVQLATERITMVELRALEKLVVLNRQLAEAGEWEPFLENDAAFHHGIARATHNPFLMETIVTVIRLQASILKMIGGRSGILLTAAEQHEAIFHAIKEGQSDVAVQAMTTHVDTVLHAYQQDVRRRLLLDDTAGE